MLTSFIMVGDVQIGIHGVGDHCNGGGIGRGHGEKYEDNELLK